MDYREALKWATYYHAVSLGAAAVGLALVGVGAFFGLSGSLAAFSGGSPLAGSTWAAAIGEMNPLPLLVAVPLGLLVWRVGRTTARLKATAAAADAGVDLPAAGVETADRATDELADRTEVEEPAEAGFASETGIGSGPGADTGGEAESDTNAPADGTETGTSTGRSAAGGATMAFGDDADGSGDERATLEHADDAEGDDAGDAEGEGLIDDAEGEGLLDDAESEGLLDDAESEDLVDDADAGDAQGDDAGDAQGEGEFVPFEPVDDDER